MAKISVQFPIETRFLKEAASAFYDLQNQCVGIKQRRMDVPEEFERHFAAAAYAVATLQSIGLEELRGLEGKGIVHRSTITGGSLSAATVSLEGYLNHGENSFDSDVYEQLSRSCRSAFNILDCKKRSILVL